MRSSAQIDAVDKDMDAENRLQERIRELEEELEKASPFLNSQHLLTIHYLIQSREADNEDDDVTTPTLWKAGPRRSHRKARRTTAKLNPTAARITTITTNVSYEVFP